MIDKSLSSLVVSVMIKWLYVAVEPGENPLPVFVMRRQTATILEGAGAIDVSQVVGHYLGEFATEVLSPPIGAAAVSAAISKSLDAASVFHNLIPGLRNPNFTELLAPVLLRVRDRSHRSVRTAYAQGIFDRCAFARYMKRNPIDDAES